MIGKGEKENYVSFCPHCNTEYLIELHTCTRCGGKTISQKERREQLLSKVDEFKKRKLRRAERRKKWDLWKKTKAMHWKKTSTSYEKWEYFTDSEDEYAKLEKESEPIVPEDDPNFRALKHDMDERQRKIKKKRKEAEELKKKANGYMKKKNYLMAVKLYTQAIQLDKPNKYLWTNRALAQLKREKWQEAINDTTRILEYCEVLEDGFTRSKDACFKAFARRALGYKGLKDYKKALKDVERCLELFPEDESAALLKKELERLAEKSKKMDEIKVDEQEDKAQFVEQLNEDQKSILKEIDYFVGLGKAKLSAEEFETAKGYNYLILNKIAHQKNEKLMLYFIKQGGALTLKKLFKRRCYDLSYKVGSVNYCSFLHSILKENELLNEEVIECNFARLMIKRINSHLNAIQESSKKAGEEAEAEDKAEAQAEETQNQKNSLEMKEEDRLQEIEEFSEVLICMTENRQSRIYFDNKSHLITPIFKLLSETLIHRLDTEHALVSNLLTIFSNLLIKKDKNNNINQIKDFFVPNYLPFIFNSVCLILKKTHFKFLNLKRTCLAFFSNLMVYPEVRAFSLSRLIAVAGASGTKEAENGVEKFMTILLQDCLSSTQKIVDKYGKLGENLRKYLDNTCSMLLNMSHGLNDRSSMAKIVNVLKDRNLNRLVFTLIEIISSHRNQTPDWDILLKKLVSLCSRYFSAETVNEYRKEYIKVTETLLSLMKDKRARSADYFDLLVVDANKLFVVMIEADGEIKTHLYSKILSPKHEEFFEKLLRFVKEGASQQIVR